MNVRFTESQSQKIMDYLKDSKINYKTKSEFIRNMILNKIGRKERYLTVDSKEV